MNLDEMIKVGMADLKVGKSPDVLTTLGLGSCVGVAIYDPVTKISGLLHCMLPDSTQFRNNSNKAKYADSGIDELERNATALVLRTSLLLYLGLLCTATDCLYFWLVLCTSLSLACL